MDKLIEQLKSAAENERNNDVRKGLEIAIEKARALQEESMRSKIDELEQRISDLEFQRYFSELKNIVNEHINARNKTNWFWWK